MEEFPIAGVEINGIIPIDKHLLLSIDKKIIDTCICLFSKDTLFNPKAKGWV